MLGSDEDRAWYGPDHVELAASRGAIGTLLISDELFRQVLCPSKVLGKNTSRRANDAVQRKRFITLVEGVREKGGEVLIFSSMHESGQREHVTYCLYQVVLLMLAS